MDNRPLPRGDRQRLFRGEAAWRWEQRLREKNWPQPLAGLLAHFLTGDGPLPSWPTALASEPEEELPAWLLQGDT